jgi:hypothetical protein
MFEGLLKRVLLVGAVSVSILSMGVVSPAVAQTPSTTTVTALLSDGTNTGTSLTEPPNTTVTDAATLAGTDVSTASGTVTYLVFSDSKCSKVVDDNQVTVTDGVVPPSSPETLSKAGTYYWTVVYSGDSNNAAGVEACGSEIETVATGPIVDTSTDSATCQASGKLTFAPPLVNEGTASETASIAVTLKSCEVSGAPAVVIKSATWHATMPSFENACTALASLPSLSATIAFSTTPTMKSNSTNIVFNDVAFNGNTLGDTTANANAASGTAPFEGSDSGATSGFSLSTSVTASQAATTCSKKRGGLKSIKIVHGLLSLG